MITGSFSERYRSLIKQRVTSDDPQIVKAWRRFELLNNILEQGHVICIDGATGTELTKNGVTGKQQWNGWPAQLYAPESLRKVHKTYCDNGADIIICNTYGTSLHVMGEKATPKLVREANLKAVELVKEVAESSERQVFVAGSISNHPPQLPEGAKFVKLDKVDDKTINGVDIGNWPSPEQEMANYSAQAQALKEGGVDFIFMELLKDSVHAPRAIQAAISTGLPVFVGLTLGRRKDGLVVLRDDHQHKPLSVMGPDPLSSGIVGINVMHCGINEMNAQIEQVRQAWGGWIGAYPNSGIFVVPEWIEKELLPSDFVRMAERWNQLGANMIGGCCGIGPSHIASLSQWIATKNVTKAKL